MTNDHLPECFRGYWLMRLMPDGTDEKTTDIETVVRHQRIMNDFFATLIIGHLIGDYLLQNKWMAMNKSGNSWKCAVHCAIYTAAVTAMTWPSIHGWGWSLLVFTSHFPVDRWSLADKWLDLINSRSLRDFIANGKKEIPPELDAENYHALRGGFTALVYAAADNTLHLATMYYGAKLIWA